MMLAVLQGVVLAQSAPKSEQAGARLTVRFPAPGRSGIPYTPLPAPQGREIRKQDRATPEPPEPGDRRKLLPRQWRNSVPEPGPKPSRRMPS